jgi:WhiB family redox-sensing transcriptional regulator
LRGQVLRSGENSGAQPVNGADVSWRAHASCRLTSPELFFPVGTTGTAVETIRDAKAVCGGCAVRDACLQFALETNQECGIWGGTSEDERRRFRRSWLAGRHHRTR